MLTPPLLAGAVQLSWTCPPPGLAVKPVGIPGGVPATGDAVMVTLDVAVFAGEDESVTVSVAVYVLALVYVWLGFCAVLTADPSPKFQLYEYGAVPPVAEPAKDTVS